MSRSSDPSQIPEEKDVREHMMIEGFRWSIGCLVRHEDGRRHPTKNTRKTEEIGSPIAYPCRVYLPTLVFFVEGTCWQIIRPYMDPMGLIFPKPGFC